MADYQKSARVELELVVDGTTHVLSQVGNGFLIARDECHVSPGKMGQLRISVNDNVRTREVLLPHGVSGAGVEARTV